MKARPALTLAELNAADRDRFVNVLGWIFENSPWVADRAWGRRPFASIDALHEAMNAVVAAADRSEQLALLRAHPDLGGTPPRRSGRQGGTPPRRSGRQGGTPPRRSGRRGTRARMSDASAGEQAGAGLDRLTPTEFERMQQLNAEYRRKFGFPFLFAVKGSTKHDVLAALEHRLAADADAELAEALRQIARIARFRLQELITA